MYTATTSIGAPGCGKTTLFELMALRENAVYVSADDTRLLITGSTTDHTREAEVWDSVFAKIETALLEGYDVFIDVTNANGNHRRKLIEHCKKHARMIIGIWFDIPKDVCKSRNRSRDRVVPEYVIDRMYDQLQNDPPSYADGFDLISHRTS